MKQFILLASLVLTTIAFTQNAAFTKPVNLKIKFKYNTVNIYQNNVTYRYMQGKRIYEIYDFNTGIATTKEIERVKVSEISGDIMRACIIEDTLYELLRFQVSPLLKKFKVGLLKRSMETMKELNFVMLPEEYLMDGTATEPSVELFHTDEHLYICGKSNMYDFKHYFAAAFDRNLKEVWKHDLSFLFQDGVNHSEFTIVDGENAMMELQFTNPGKGFQFKQSKITPTALSYLLFNSDGELELISPKLEQTFVFTGSTFFYNAKTEEIKTIFWTKEITDPKKQKVAGTGYAFFKWNKEGEVLSSQQKIFSIGEVWNDDVRTYLKDNGVSKPKSNEELLPTIHNRPFARQLDNGSIMVSMNSLRLDDQFASTQNSLLEKCDFHYLIDGDGNLSWTKFDTPKQDPLLMFSNYFEFNDKLFKITRESTEPNVKNVSYDYLKGYENKLSSAVYLQEIDITTGELLDKIKVDIPEEYKAYSLSGHEQFDENSNELIIKFINNSTEERIRAIIVF